MWKDYWWCPCLQCVLFRFRLTFRGGLGDSRLDSRQIWCQAPFYRSALINGQEGHLATVNFQISAVMVTWFRRPPSQSQTDPRTSNWCLEISQRGLIETIKVLSFVHESLNLPEVFICPFTFCSLPVFWAFPGLSEIPVSYSKELQSSEEQRLLYWPTPRVSVGIVCQRRDHLITVSWLFSSLHFVTVSGSIITST